ncbi:MAG: AraC family transcriptional regulator [Cyanobacteria bacterium J06634_5]
MTIKVTMDEFDSQFQEADEEELQWDASDELDLTYKFDACFSRGWSRRIQLREGIKLSIDRHQPVGRLILNEPEHEGHFITCIFTLSGRGLLIVPSTLSEILFPRTAGKYLLNSNGLCPHGIVDESDIEPYCHLFIRVRPSILRSFVPSPEGELPINLQHLIKTPSQEQYIRSGDINSMMTNVLQQILNCPYKGLVKRAYLESKVIELIALVLDHEIAIQQGEVKQGALKPEQLERVHYAKEILLRDLSNPPSLEALARQAGLNDFLLKKGFRQAFGTTVFGELRSHRLKLAQQLLAEQDYTVAEVAHQIGYASVGAFAKAFHKRFGLGPKAYQKSRQK